MALHAQRAIILLAALAGCAAAAPQEPKTLNGHRGGVFCVSFSPDGRILASASSDHTIRLWQLRTDTDSQEAQRRRRLLAELDDDRFWVRERASDELLALGRAIEPELRQALSQAASLEVRARLRRLLVALRPPDDEQHQAEVRCLAFSPDGRLVASGSKDQSIKLWSAVAGRVLATIDGRSGTIWSLAFSPDGSILASGGMDHCVRLWEVPTGRLRATLQGHAGPVHSLAFSPDGTTLASAGSFDGTVRLWNMPGGDPKAALKQNGSAVLCVAFSPDGQTLASAGYEGVIQLWNLAADQPRPLVGSFPAHSNTIRALAFSPDGKTLASASEDNSAKLWQLGSGKLLAALNGHSGGVYSVTFSPDGQTLATASLDGTVKLWDVSRCAGAAVVGQAP
jgi:WD40 repeat protein